MEESIKYEDWDIEKKKAEEIFSKSFLSFLDQYGDISAFRSNLRTAIPLSKTSLFKENLSFISDALKDPIFRAIFKDPDSLEKDEKYVQFTLDVTKRSIQQTERGIESASIVFLHSVLDALLYHYCKVSALIIPLHWFKYVKNKKDSLQELHEKTRSKVIIDACFKFVESIEKKSLLYKADKLHEVCLENAIFPNQVNPPKIQNYAYSKDRLEKFDKLRHNIVHHSTFSDEISDVDELLRYIYTTGFYFTCLMNQSYNLRIDPNINETIQQDDTGS